jgi:hypothetical protein
LSKSELKILTNEELFAGRSYVVLDDKSKYQRAVVACLTGINGMVKLFLVNRGCHLSRSLFKTDFKFMLSEFATEPTLVCPNLHYLFKNND